MPKKSPRPNKLSPSAERELQRLLCLCRRLKLSAASVRKAQRIIRILINDP
ncbi:MAG: hypothetical protein IH899_16290 [Planctomycetes bacterium]|nr:hypothetical protein [Planctomycetota bacterium]